MTKKKSQPENSNNLIFERVAEEIKSCRPLRLFINKQKKKGSHINPFALRSKFLQLSSEKQIKYYQKSIDKFIQLLDDKDIDVNVQIERKLFEILLTKIEQKKYFESMSAPIKPVSTAVGYYAEIKKQENDDNPKAWKLLSADEKKHYTNLLRNAKYDYNSQIKHFSENLPERLKVEYLSFVKRPRTSAHVKDMNGENSSPAPISQRRKSVQPIPENFQALTDDAQQKLNRIQLDALHKCKPDVLYYEKKNSDDDQLTFINTTAKNTYIRTIFNQLSEKKKHKFVLKSTKKWEEFLQSHPTVVENQIPTLHLLLAKKDYIHYYFTSLGLPERPPTSALFLFNHERQETDSQQNWTDLSQSTKDEFIKRLSKIKLDYHQNFLEFVEKTLPSDYVRLEFFRNIKHAAKDYETAVKDRVDAKDDGQLKITQYLVKKQIIEVTPVSEFDRIKQQLLNTDLTDEQRKLVRRLGIIMHKNIC
ncbi:unnamed protein product [Rotaria magnacalcarata]|uniref:Uncharacterized protein n=3 Tax=Rotaria magnacalcarata TaxID=392030 RepID=A0A819TV57_9BILA|nr:unnamed protein product [Rotaria magnacalcarata]CAF4081199.1 unnamed protein product [Rotaria magnacalcarata]